MWLPWGPPGCTEGDRRGLATDGGVNMIGTQLKGRLKGTAKYQTMNCACEDASRAGQGLWYRISIVATLLPLRTRPTMTQARAFPWRT